MFGHTHTDLFKLYQPVNPSEPPAGVFTVCGSITTWGSLNPSYCEYELDRETLLPVKRRTYFFDISKANQTGQIEWELATDWTQEYQEHGLVDLSPTSYQKFATSLNRAGNEEVALNYLQHGGRNLGCRASCDQACQLSTYCEAITIDPYAYDICNGSKIWDWRNRFMGSFRQAMLTPWVTEDKIE